METRHRHRRHSFSRLVQLRQQDNRNTIGLLRRASGVTFTLTVLTKASRAVPTPHLHIRHHEQQQRAGGNNDAL
eukprot:5085990-Heterocapsa_arctica.AAC.1